MRILILGGLGMIGHQMYLQLSQEFNQLHVCIRRPLHTALKYGIFNPTQVIDNVDLLHQKTLEVTLRNVNPDLIVNCAGSTLAKTKNLNSSEIIELNALFPHRLYEWCLEHSAFLIHFSNDEIFIGRDIPYDESSLPDARTIYGRSKALGEIDGRSCLTIRSSFLGPELESSTELFARLYQNPEQRVAASKREYYCGVSTTYLARMVAKLIRQGLPLEGLYQVASQPISEYDLLQVFNQQFHWNLKISELPGNPEQQKILSNEKITKYFALPPPRWIDMAAEINHNLSNYACWKQSA